MQSLIERLTALYEEVSARLLQLRVSRAQHPPTTTDEVGLVQALVERLYTEAMAVAQTAAEQGEAAPEEPPTPVARADARPREESPGAAPTPSTETAPVLPSGERSPALSRDATASLQPSFAAQLKRQTLRYLGQALDFGRHGNAELAETCARYAENTLKLAAQHLPPEDFRRFRDEVLARLTGSGEGNPPSDPAGPPARDDAP